MLVHNGPQQCIQAGEDGYQSLAGDARPTVAAAYETISGRAVTARSGLKGKISEWLQGYLDGIGQRNDFAGECAEIDCLRQLSEDEAVGGISRAVEVRGIDNAIQGQERNACAVCRSLLARLVADFHLNSSLIATAEPRLKTALRSFGWYEERKVAVSGWFSTLNSHRSTPSSIKPFPAVTRFLEEFGGLRLGYYPSSNSVFVIDSVVFDPVRAGLAEMDRAQTWIVPLGMAVYPIGELDGYQMVLAEDGSMYYNSAGNGKRVGETVEDALMVLIFRETRPVLLFPHLQGG